VQSEPLLQVQIALLIAAAALVAVMLGFFAIAIQKKNSWHTVHQIVEGEGRMLRCYRYANYALKRETMSIDEEIKEVVEEQEKALRKRATKGICEGIEHKLKSAEVLAENIKEMIGGAWEPIDVTAFAPKPKKMEPEFAHLEQEVPPRFLIVVAFCVSITVILVYLALYFVAALSKFAKSAAVYLPPENPLDPTSNALLQDTLIQSVSMVAELVPSSQFTSLEGFKPLVRELNFVTIVNALATFVKNVAPIIEPLGIAATAVGVLSVLFTLVLVTRTIRDLQRELRQGVRHLDEAELEEADEYVGVHVIGIVLTFFMGFLCVIVVYAAVVLIYYNLGFLWGGCRNAVLCIGGVALFELIAGKTVALLCHKGLYFTAPRLYMVWSAVAGVLSLFGAVPVIIKRYAQALISMIFLFARYDLRLFPTTLVTEDLAHTRLMSMLVVDHHHNNAIVLTFVGYLLFGKEMRSFVGNGKRVVSVRDCGRSSPFPQIRTMIRVVAAVSCGATSGKCSAPRTLPNVWYCKLLRFVCPYTDVVEDVTRTFEPSEVYPAACSTVARRRAVQRWNLAVLLVLNPSLCRLRKHALPRLCGYHYVEESEEEDEESGAEKERRESEKGDHLDRAAASISFREDAALIAHEKKKHVPLAEHSFAHTAHPTSPHSASEEPLDVEMTSAPVFPAVPPP
jgi:hypothetical protein